MQKLEELEKQNQDPTSSLLKRLENYKQKEGKLPPLIGLENIANEEFSGNLSIHIPAPGTGLTYRQAIKKGLTSGG